MGVRALEGSFHSADGTGAVIPKSLVVAEVTAPHWDTRGPKDTNGHIDTEGHHGHDISQSTGEKRALN